MPDFELEKEALQKGYKYVCGVDEAGRGPLAGPVCAAAVILKEDTVIEGLNDSKKISEKKREALFDVIKENAVAYCIAYGTVEEIETVNILEATKLAMYQAIDNSKIKPEHVLIDAMKLENLDMPSTSIIKGDAKSISIAAASVIAKVTRDRMMLELDSKYPMYGFKKHKGYPTKQHVEAIEKYGILDSHRKTFKPVSLYVTQD